MFSLCFLSVFFIVTNIQFGLINFFNFDKITIPDFLIIFVNMKFHDLSGLEGLLIYDSFVIKMVEYAIKVLSSTRILV